MIGLDFSLRFMIEYIDICAFTVRKMNSVSRTKNTQSAFPVEE